MKDHLNETTLARNHPVERPPIKNPLWSKTTLMILPWWKTISLEDHPYERPHQWEITLLRDYPDERPLWWVTPLWKITMRRDHPNRRPPSERSSWWAHPEWPPRWEIIPMEGHLNKRPPWWANPDEKPPRWESKACLRVTFPLTFLLHSMLTHLAPDQPLPIR